MPDMYGFDLLVEYGRRGSEAAFTALTELYIRLVYSAALRQVNDRHLAEEVSVSRMENWLVALAACGR